MNWGEWTETFHSQVSAIQVAQQFLRQGAMSEELQAKMFEFLNEARNKELAEQKQMGDGKCYATMVAEAIAQKLMCEPCGCSDDLANASVEWGVADLAGTAAAKPPFTVPTPQEQMKQAAKMPVFVQGANGSPNTLGLYWSSFECALHVPGLVQLGITHRLNLAAGLVDKFDRSKGTIMTFHIPMQDQLDQEGQQRHVWADQIGQAVAVLRSLKAEGAVVNVSCKMGKNRSGVVLLAWLVVEEGWEFESAVIFLRDKVPLACGNPYLLSALTDYLQIDHPIPLCPAPGGGGWVSLSPPGSPAQPSTKLLNALADDELAL